MILIHTDQTMFQVIKEISDILMQQAFQFLNHLIKTLGIVGNNFMDLQKKTFSEVHIKATDTMSSKTHGDTDNTYIIKFH